MEEEAVGGPDHAGSDSAALRVRLERIEQQNAALMEAQAALGAQIAALQDHANLVGHMVQEIHAGRRQRLLPRLALPLPLVRLGELVTAPGPSLAYLTNMVRLGVVTGTSVVADGAGGWRLKRRPLAIARNMARDFSALVFGRRSVVYRVRPHHPPLAVRPRVLHVIPNVYVGGSTQLVVDLLERLGHRYEMQVVTAGLPPNGRHEGMVLHHLPLGSPPAAFTDLLSSVRPDIVHLHYWGESDRPWYEAALAAARESDAVLVENVNTPVAPLRDPRIHTYVFVSDYIRQAFAPDIANGQVVHPGIDLDRFSPRDFAPGAEDTVGMVYRLTRDKLDDESIVPLIDVALRRPKTRFLIVGDGDLLPVFLARVTAAGVRRNFEFAGTVPFDALPEIYRRFRLFVAPVVRESFGQVTPFAMAMGQAVAGYRVGALAEILGSDTTLGTSRAALADILVALLDDRERLNALGAVNSARAPLFALEGMISSYARIYAEALGRDVDLMPGFPPARFYREV
ncbi:glycosyltransferase family 4 protein [Xanthobacter autotrophicus]|uniref:glycosyltransferase family 4 protein n=1 Tax=Xanthobacter TaxID=279 RepID=UPI0024AABB0D|nr:glycosyltransferase family 4 protein [Xanthobacter autotrophicus]MDI4663234.1 glycosyltransferase family 4 protein [Xanthobacter autotrophicus]